MKAHVYKTKFDLTGKSVQGYMRQLLCYGKVECFVFPFSFIFRPDYKFDLRSYDLLSMRY